MLLSIEHEAVMAFINRFNKRAVFSDSTATCPNVLNPKTPIGMKLQKIIMNNYVDKNGNIPIDEQFFYKLGCHDLRLVLDLCYIGFAYNITDKLNSEVFSYITKVYKQTIEFLK